ncbi:FadR/GntR family transcriptional regulator [Rhizobium sp. NPDC090275]|uniref:FadR/GntR family transcriptional regulator n=1 Tax=Rhizobium sp. NPDC090275 TaxID=3364498 RepID=UPI00383ABB09
MSIITQRGNLAEIVVARLTDRIETGQYGPGERIPSSLQLCEEFGVSRTVIREALTSLKVAGRVTTRQGAGVFVTGRDGNTISFEISRIEDIRSAMQILELRLGVELQSVALAASRRTPEALAEIARAFDSFDRLESDDIEAEARADFEFHLSIARATRNPHFPSFLIAVMESINFDLLLKLRQSGRAHTNYVKKINREHGSIVAAITQGDSKAARHAMDVHLSESLNRYRALLEDVVEHGGSRAN